MVTARIPIAFLFPGQGSQRPGMLDQLREDSISAATVDEAKSILGRDLAALDTAEALAGTEATQLALLIVGVACARMLDAAGIRADYVAGHSIGAFAAATHAGVLSFRDALRLVEIRGSAMAAAHPRGFGMAAISGIPQGSLEERLESERSRGAVLYLANLNGARQFTVSGADADLANVMEWARGNGASKAIRLDVATPSHSPLMNGVAARMRDAFDAIVLGAPRVPYLANRSARVLDDSRAIATDLAASVAEPVRWHEGMSALYERGGRGFIEMRPGVVLTHLMRNSFPDAQPFALESTGISTLRELFAAD